MHQNSPFELKNGTVYWGGGCPPPDPSPVGRATPPPHTLAPSAPLAPRSSRLQRSTLAPSARPPNLQHKSPPMTPQTVSCFADVQSKSNKHSRSANLHQGLQNISTIYAYIVRSIELLPAKYSWAYVQIIVLNWLLGSSKAAKEMPIAFKHWRCKSAVSSVVCGSVCLVRAIIANWSRLDLAHY